MLIKLLILVNSHSMQRTPSPHRVQLNSAENEISELRPMIPLLQKEASDAKNTRECFLFVYIIIQYSSCP